MNQQYTTPIEAIRDAQFLANTLQHPHAVIDTREHGLIVVPMEDAIKKGRLIEMVRPTREGVSA